MAEPFSECGARGEIFSPGIKLQVFLRAASWPHAVHENPDAIVWDRLAIGAFDLDHDESESIPGFLRQSQ